MVARRIAREYVAQILAFGVALADRLLVAAVLVRIWGVDDFAAWTVATSFAGVASVFDFGINLYFSNQVMFHVQSGRTGDDVRFFRAGNSFALVSALVGLVAAGVAIGIGRTGESSVPITGPLVVGALALAGATAIRMSASVQLSAYRAHSEYARQTNMLMVLDLVRIAFTVLAVLGNQGFVFVALGHLAINAVIVLGAIRKDVQSRFPRFQWRLGWLYGAERHQALKTCFGYWMAAAPSTILTYLPIFLLTFIGASQFAIAQFALMRTISGFVRTVLQQFSIVLGQEVARRLAVGDDAGVRVAYRESSILLTIQTAVAAGILVVTGQQLFGYWTGRSDMFDDRLLWLSLAPVVSVPALTLAQNFFASANLPWSMVIGRAAQMALSIGFFFFLPIGSDVLRLTVALGAAELLGLGIPVMVRASQVVGGAGLYFNLALLVRGMAGLLIVAGPCALLQHYLFAPPAMVLMSVLALGGALSVVTLYGLGMSAQRQAQLLVAGRALVSRLQVSHDGL